MKRQANHGTRRWTGWMWRSGLMMLGVLVLGVAHAAISVDAALDRHHAQLGDTLTLTVTVSGSADASQPDFDVLKPDFRLLGTSRSASVRFENGRQTSSTTWNVQLQPRHAGTLTVPALQVDGARTAPQRLMVTAASAGAQGRPHGRLFVTMTPDIDNPYVGQQVTLNVRLFYDLTLNRGSIETPQVDGLDVRKLGDDARYQSERDGRQYEVVEEHYAVIAQHAGRVVLPPVSFAGRVAATNMFRGLGGFFNTDEIVHASSAPVTFEVRPRPASDVSGAWLPAREVQLSLRGLPANGRVQLGEPLTLTLTERATGLPFEALPTPTLPKLSGADVYPDQPRGTTSDDGNWLHGVRSRAFALVPQRSGPLTIPEITLRWWNVNDNRLDEASLPARTLTVTTAGAGSSSASSGGTGRAAAADAAPAAAASSAASPMSRHGAHLIIADAPASSGDGHWRALAELALGLWVLSLLLVVVWLLRRRWRRRAPRSARPAAPPPRHPQAVFLQALRSGDTAAQAAALLAWAHAERPRITTLEALSAALQPGAQRDVIAALQRARYAVAAAPPDDAALQAAFTDGLQWADTATVKPASALPPLYPQ